MAKLEARLFVNAKPKPNYLEQELNTFHETSKCIEWQKAMTVNINALLSNDTWDLVLKPLNANLVSIKWVIGSKGNKMASL